MLSFIAALPLVAMASASPLEFNPIDVTIDSSYGGDYRAAFVAQAFQTAWDGYAQYAFGADELMPASNQSVNPYGGWGATAIDALDTAIVMGKTDIVDKILDFVPTIDWSAPADNMQISLFETTIRYLGGLLSAYDLLTGPLASLAPNDTSKVDALLTQATNLANNLSFAFDTVTGIPHNDLFVHNQTNGGSTTNNLAQIGSLVLEWTHLADLTGNQTYAELAQKGESYLLNPQPAQFLVHPGLLGNTVNITSGLFLNEVGGWIGGSDSFYEYLIKMYVYDPSRFSTYKDNWETAADAAAVFLSSVPEGRNTSMYLSEYNITADELVWLTQHLACFAGGNFILGGLALQTPGAITYGLELVNGCEAAYNGTATGIGPDSWGWYRPSVPEEQEAFYNKTGIYYLSPAYYLRPEHLESLYYAYRATGDEMYRDWSWAAVSSILNTTRVGSGYSEIKNVTVSGGGGFLDMQDSYFLAEVLKYAYLTFADDAQYQLENSQNQSFVFNTEGHPFKVASLLG